MLIFLKRTVTAVLITTFTFLNLTTTANATLISTQQIAAESSIFKDRGSLVATLDRPEVQAQLESFGISKEEAQQRIASLTDEEVVALNNKIDGLPAGAGVVGALVLIFVVLLVTDILGFTRVFPFTRTAAR
jgi:hypothetical protein